MNMTQLSIGSIVKEEMNALVCIEGTSKAQKVALSGTVYSVNKIYSLCTNNLVTTLSVVKNLQ